MRLFVNGSIREASEQEVVRTLNQSVLQQPISVWEPILKSDGFRFVKNMKFSEMVKHIAYPELLHPEVKKKVDRVLAGDLAKTELFGYCIATFNPEPNGWVRRLKNNHSTYTKLVQLDLDLKHEPGCDADYVEYVLQSIYDATDLGKHILLCGKSISKKGLYLYLQTDTEDTDVLEVVIRRVYELLNKVFRFQNPDKTLDTSVTDVINRLRYYAPDQDLVINPDVQPIDTSPITVRKKVYSKTIVSQSGNTFRELEIIRQAENKLLKGYNNITYTSGFHSDFLRFSTSCMSKGVTRATLEKYTQQRFGQLYNQEKRKYYLTELLRVIESSEKFLMSQ